MPILDGLVFVEPFGAYEEQMQKAFAATVGDLMTREVRTIPPDETIHEAAKKMAKHDISRLAVVESGKLVGLDDREQRTRAESLAESPNVGADRAELDDDPRALRQRVPNS